MARAKNYTLGAGKLYFDRLDANGASTGEFYIGNTPSLTYSVDEERQEHYSSDEAAREKDASIVIRSDVTVAFTTDDIQPENVAMMFKGEAETLVVAGATNLPENVTVRKGRWHQLGVDADNPSGVRQITIDSVSSGAVLDTDYEVDLELGRIYWIEDAPNVNEDEVVVVTYDQVEHSRTIVISTGDQVRGSLRYIADNTTGRNDDHFWPYIEVSPDGDYEFKGDSWNEMSFTCEALTSGDLAKHYIDGRPVVGT